ncbi:hypothetical protein AURDEDRAFT_186331 [Auricularia subglabra TFB-10046 SS5]|nr:hypothetical protein AURDEDRAFT_186331 [Auricularia subglabra TFB-10046 SS5]
MFSPVPHEHDDSGSNASEEESFLGGEHKGGATKSTHEPLHPLAIWTFIACLSLCVVNIALLLRETTHAESVMDLDKLDRPSTYIDLDTLEWAEERLAKLPPIVNYPIIMAPVSRMQPHRVWPEDPRAWMTHEGMVSPDEQEVLVTQDVSVIVQFRVLDHKMERCSVVAQIPTEAEIRARNRDNNVDLDGVTTVQVYRLDAQRTLKRRDLSYATKPPRREHIGEFKVSMGHLNGTAEFDCKERSLQTFEIACPGRRCHINFWQDRNKPVLAFYLRQTHSLVKKA